MTKFQELTRSYAVWDDTQIRGFFGFGHDEYGWLSNFYLCDVMFDGQLYPSSEHAYMASKTICSKEREQFLKKHEGELTPQEAKKAGQRVTLRENWDTTKQAWMFVVIFDKFKRNGHLRDRLLETNDKYLEETNHWDDLFYGVDYITREGENWLGIILMMVRERLREENQLKTLIEENKK